MSYYYYTIAQVILAFWLVLSYDLLEDRYTIDVITTKFLKWRKVLSFTWLAEEKVQKRLVEALNRYEKQEKAVSFLENDSEKILKQSQSAVERD